MSFLESIQHGLEKATQEASRIAKIQHLHNVATDLNFKSSQQGQNLASKAMEMYHQGILAQGELTAICKQIDDYQQQMAEVQAELQKLQSPDDDATQQAVPPTPQVPGAYPAYPQAAPGTVPPGYPAYPGVPVQPPVAPTSEPPTQPLTSPAAPSAPAEAEAQPTPHKAHHHATAKATPEAAAPTAESSEQAAPLAGTYANGVLPPVFSPFASKPAAAAPDAAPADDSEAAKPKAHHSTKKAAASAEDAPAKD